MPTGTPAHQAGISKKPAPGQPGTKRYQRQSGDALAIAYGETELRHRVKQAGGKWGQDRKVWLLPYGLARKPGLHGRIRKLGGEHG